MKTINELQDEVIEEFTDYEDSKDKSHLLFDLGNNQQPFYTFYKTDLYLKDLC